MAAFGPLRPSLNRAFDFLVGFWPPAISVLMKVFADFGFAPPVLREPARSAKRPAVYTLAFRRTGTYIHRHARPSLISERASAALTRSKSNLMSRGDSRINGMRFRAIQLSTVR